jgi:hypothetical protein
MKRWTPLICVMIVLCLAAAAAHACPACKDSVPNSDAEAAGNVPGGFNNSVYFMLASFVSVLGFVTTFIVRTIRTGNHSRGHGFPID